jgi:thioredoxin 1
MATFNEIIDNEKPVLVDFSAEWCGPCKMLAPQLKELAGLMQDDVKIVKIDVDRNAQLASQLQVQGVPTLMLYQKGKLLWRQSGFMHASQLQKVIEQYKLKS